VYLLRADLYGMKVRHQLQAKNESNLTPTKDMVWIREHETCPHIMFTLSTIAVRDGDGHKATIHNQVITT
jgi:hypothetical protein